MLHVYIYIYNVYTHIGCFLRLHASGALVVLTVKCAVYNGLRVYCVCGTISQSMLQYLA